MRSVYRATTAAICAFLTGCAIAQGVSTNGTMLADDLTSRSRVVVDAFENSSNRVHTLIETVSPRTSLEPATNYTDLVAESITNILNSAIDKKADKTRDTRVIGSVVVPERISGSLWSHGGDGAAADVGELTYNGHFSEQEGVVVWTGTAPYTITGEEGTFYTWAIAVYDAFGDTFVGYCSQGNLDANIDYGEGGMVSNSFTSVLGLSWKDSFATLDTPEPDALNWGNVEGIGMYGQITVSTYVTGVEHVVYSGELQSATNGVMNVVTNEIPAHFTDWVAPNPFSGVYYYAPNREWIEAYGETTSEYYTVSITLTVPSEGMWNVYAESYLYQNGEWGVWITTDKYIYAPSNTETLVVERFLNTLASATFTREFIPAKNALGLARLIDLTPLTNGLISAATATNISYFVTTNYVDNSLTNRPTKAEMDAGWWSEWSFSGGEPPSGRYWEIRFSSFGSQYNLFALPDGTSIDDYTEDELGNFYVDSTSIGYSADATELTFSSPSVTATRHRVAAPVPTKISDITNDVGYVSASTATNIASTVSSSAIASADTTYRRTIGITNLNQSVQYVNITDTTPTTLAISMPTDGATKDWMVYVVSVTNVTLSLPSATWWMADTAYTNDVPPATPTALWFSQVTDGVFLLGRQELTPVSIEGGN